MAKATKGAAPKKAATKKAPGSVNKSASRSAKKKVDHSPSKAASRTRKPAVSPQTARRSNKPKLQAWERGEAVECAPNE